MIIYKPQPILFLFAISIAVLTGLPHTAWAEETDVNDLPKESIKALYLSQQAIQAENYDEAIGLLTEYMASATEEVPVPAFQMLGHAYYGKDDVENARKTFARGHEAFPESADILLNLAVLTYELGDREKETARLFEKLYRLTGQTDPKYLYQAASLYFYSRELREAKRVLDQLLSSKHKAELKWYDDMIAICVELNQMGEAEKWAKETLAREPGQARYWRLLAQMRLDREEYKAAASALEIAHRLEGAKKGDWLELSELYLYLNAPLMAIRCMEFAYPAKMPEKRKAKIAATYARTLRFEEAMKYLDEALREKPSADLLFEKGRVLYDAMRYEEAIVALEQCSKMDPQYGQAYILAGFAAWNMKQWEQARSAFVKASVLPKFRDQANDAVGVLDDLMTAMADQAKSDF